MFEVQLTFEQHRFELHRLAHGWIFFSSKLYSTIQRTAAASDAAKMLQSCPTLVVWIHKYGMTDKESRLQVGSAPLTPVLFKGQLCIWVLSGYFISQFQ